MREGVRSSDTVPCGRKKSQQVEESVTGVRKGRDGTRVSRRALVMETGAVIGADQDRAGVSPTVWLASLGVENSRNWSASHGCWWGHQMLPLENPG